MHAPLPPDITEEAATIKRLTRDIEDRDRHLTYLQRIGTDQVHRIRVLEHRQDQMTRLMSGQVEQVLRAFMDEGTKPEPAYAIAMDLVEALYNRAET